jgi:hypothetical protein
MVARIISFLPPKVLGTGAGIAVKLSSANVKVNTPCGFEFPDSRTSAFHQKITHLVSAAVFVVNEGFKFKP